MKILLVGATGVLGTAVGKALTGRGHQVVTVGQGTRHVAERGSFTLIAGVLGEEPIVTGSAAAMVNGALEAFVRAAAVEIAPQRVNAVSPTVFAESMAEYGDFFPGDQAGGVDEVAAACVRSIGGAETGQVFRVQ